MTQLVDKLRYDFNHWEEIGDYVRVPIIRKKKGTNGTYEI